MTQEEIIEIMQDSEGRRVKVTETDGYRWVGVVDEYETDYDNEDDEVTGHSISVTADDGNCYLVYSDDIETIEIVD